MNQTHYPIWKCYYLYSDQEQDSLSDCMFEQSKLLLETEIEPFLKRVIISDGKIGLFVCGRRSCYTWLL